MAVIFAIYLGQTHLFQWQTNRFIVFPSVSTALNIIGLTVLLNFTTDPIGEGVVLQNIEIPINPIYEVYQCHFDDLGRPIPEPEARPVPPPNGI